VNKLKQLLIVLSAVATQFLSAAALVLLLPPAWLVYSYALRDSVAFVLPVAAFGALAVFAPAMAWALTKAWLIALFSLTAPFVVPFIMTPAAAESVRWRWYNTLDDLVHDQGMNTTPGPGGVHYPVPGKYESAVVDVYDALGWRWKTYYWLAGRNTAYGFAHLFRPAYDWTTAKWAVRGTTLVVMWRAAPELWDYAGQREAHMVAWPAFTGPRVMFGYKLSAYVDSIAPFKLNPKPDPAEIDVGGVPFFTVRLK
jgi:hypothetical protein